MINEKLIEDPHLQRILKISDRALKSVVKKYKKSYSKYDSVMGVPVEDLESESYVAALQFNKNNEKIDEKRLFLTVRNHLLTVINKNKSYHSRVQNRDYFHNENEHLNTELIYSVTTTTVKNLLTKYLKTGKGPNYFIESWNKQSTKNKTKMEKVVLTPEQCSTSEKKYFYKLLGFILDDMILYNGNYPRKGNKNE